MSMGVLSFASSVCLQLFFLQCHQNISGTSLKWYLCLHFTALVFLWIHDFGYTETHFNNNAEKQTWVLCLLLKRCANNCCFYSTIKTLATPL